MSTSSTIVRSTSVDVLDRTWRSSRHDSKKKNSRPVWGVLTQPTDSEERLDAFKDRYHAYIPASFVRWIESGGARVIPIAHDIDEKELRHLFDSINGVLFTGGELDDIPNTPYGKTAQRIFDWAKEANDAGDHFPLYGTCQGFQILCQMAANDWTIKERVKGCVGVSKPLEMTNKAKNSRFFGSLPPHLYNTLARTACGEHMHNWCVTPESFKKHKGLSDMFEILAVNSDDNGKVFVTCMEGKRYPFWAGQFHPERNGWEWCDEEDIDHSLDAVMAMHNLAAFLVNESCKNNHEFKDKLEEQARLIYNPPAQLVPTQVESRMYGQTFLWAYENEENDTSAVGSTESENIEVPTNPSTSVVKRNQSVD